MSERTARQINLLGAAVMLAYVVAIQFYWPPPKWLSIAPLSFSAWGFYYGWSAWKRRSSHRAAADPVRTAERAPPRPAHAPPDAEPR